MEHQANANQYIVFNFMDVVLGGSSTIEIGRDPQQFTFKLSKENVKNITTYMTYNREVEIKYTPDDITGEGASNRFALGWMLVDKAPKSSQNKKSSSRGFLVIAICFLSLFGIFFLFACFGCRPKRRLQRVVSNRLPSSLHLSQTIQVSFDNEASTTTEERSVSTRNQEENTTSRTRSNFTNEIDIGSRRDSFNNLLHLLEMAVPGNTALGEIGIDNNTLEMAEPPEGNIESNSEIGNYNSVFNDPSDSPPTYNDVTLGPSPPSEAPPPSYDEVLKMAR
ncbi:uncharacterized protein [Clytia hemisphaerica]|uniref:uncharacterized protein isoform X2 n=1 Tax=Clytia hemisphaerica TaxID=252671 RepID=UPI0034D6FAAE